MYIHAIYKIREFLSFKGFNLSKVYFSAHCSACVCYCFNAKLFRETLPVGPAVRFYYGVRCNDVGHYIIVTHFAISARERYSRLCVKWLSAEG